MTPTSARLEQIKARAEKAPLAGDVVLGYVPEIYKLGNGREVLLKDLNEVSQRRYALGGKWEELKAWVDNKMKVDPKFYFRADSVLAKMESMEREAE